MSETLELFATAATADQIDAGIGVIWFARHPADDFTLTVVDYDIFDTSTVNAETIESLFGHCAELEEMYRPTTPGCFLRVEHPGLVNVLNRADEAFRDALGPSYAPRDINRSKFDIRPIKDYEAEKWPKSLDERAFSIRPLIDSGKVVKLKPGLPRYRFRNIRTNHLVSQIKKHRPGDTESAGELLHAFVLGVLLGTTPKRGSFFSVASTWGQKSASTASNGPFGSYISGRRPL